MKAADGTHTNHIEGLFGNMKRLKKNYSICYKCTEALNIFLAEFLFRFCFEGWDRSTTFCKIIKMLRLNREMFDEEDLEEGEDLVTDTEIE